MVQLAPFLFNNPNVPNQRELLRQMLSVQEGFTNIDEILGGEQPLGGTAFAGGTPGAAAGTATAQNQANSVGAAIPQARQQIAGAGAVGV